MPYQKAVQDVFTIGASSVGVISSIYAAATDPASADTALGVGLAAVIAAIGSQVGPHVTAALKLWADDRKSTRELNSATQERKERLIELANELQYAKAQIDQLRKGAATAELLREQLEVAEARYAEAIRHVEVKQEHLEFAQKEMQAAVEVNREAIKVNAASASAIVSVLPPEIRPPGPDASQPLQHPEFDPFPDVPNPVARKSGEMPKLNEAEYE
jgi:hypothetical protein